MYRRVVVTGIGLLTPVGNSVDEFFPAILNGRSGIKTITRFDTSRARTKIAGMVESFRIDNLLTERAAARLDRAVQFALLTADNALKDACLLFDGNVVDANNIGVAIGTGAGNLNTVEQSFRTFFKEDKTDVYTISASMHHAAAANISIRYGLKGFNVTLSTACSAGAAAIGIAFNEIRHGNITCMLAGGVEAPITKCHLDNWGAMRLLSTESEYPNRAMKPFSKNRNGFVLGEGAALIILERLDSALARGAKIYGEIVGFGSTSDGAHITNPSIEGQSMAIEKALQCANLRPDEINYINAHGTATILNDKVETQAIKRIFLDHPVPVSSIKPITGHMLAASGAAEAIATILAVREGVIPPTINYEQQDPDCDLDYVVDGPRNTKLNTAMSTSFGFGGNNAVLIFRRWN
ncbi:MAG: beta-ketoacyl-[acyl-carrier-protein] synthase family protein [Acidobacteriota bacterium]